MNEVPRNAFFGHSETTTRLIWPQRNQRAQVEPCSFKTQRDMSHQSWRVFGAAGGHGIAFWACSHVNHQPLMMVEAIPSPPPLPWSQVPFQAIIIGMMLQRCHLPCYSFNVPLRCLKCHSFAYGKAMCSCRNSKNPDSSFQPVQGELACIMVLSEHLASAPCRATTDLGHAYMHHSLPLPY